MMEVGLYNACYIEGVAYLDQADYPCSRSCRDLCASTTPEVSTEESNTGDILAVDVLESNSRFFCMHHTFWSQDAHRLHMDEDPF